MAAQREDGDLWLVRVVVWRRLGSGIDPTRADVEHWNGLYPQDGSPLLLDTEYTVYNYTTRYWANPGAPRELPEVFRIDPATFEVSADPVGSMDNLQTVLEETAD